MPLASGNMQERHFRRPWGTRHMLSQAASELSHFNRLVVRLLRIAWPRFAAVKVSADTHLYIFAGAHAHLAFASMNGSSSRKLLYTTGNLSAVWFLRVGVFNSMFSR